jgi:hypothetical protein
MRPRFCRAFARLLTVPWGMPSWRAISAVSVPAFQSRINSGSQSCAMSQPCVPRARRNALDGPALVNQEVLIGPALGLRILIDGPLDTGREGVIPFLPLPLVSMPLPCFPAIVVHDQGRLELLTLIDVIDAYPVASYGPQDISLAGDLVGSTRRLALSSPGGDTPGTRARSRLATTPTHLGLPN